MRSCVAQFEDCSSKVKQLTNQHGTMVAELSEQRKQISGKELNVERLKKELNLTKDREATQLEDRLTKSDYNVFNFNMPLLFRATLELQLQHHVIEHKALFEASCRKEKEKDKELKYVMVGWRCW